MPELQYMVRRPDGAVYGPYPASTLRNFAAQGKIGPRDWVRTERGTRWEMALRAGCLAGAFPGEEPDAADLEPHEMEPDTAPAALEIAPAMEPHAHATQGTRANSPPGDADSHAIVRASGVSGSAPARPPADTTLTDEDAEAAIDIARRLQRARLPVQLMRGESVLVLRQQSFFDAAARSAISAVMGRRGTLLATTRRIAAVVPGLFGDETTVVDLSRVTSVRVGRRIAFKRMVSGSLLVFNGLLAWGAAWLFGMAGNSLSSLLGGMGDLLGGDTSYADGMVSASQVIRWIGLGLIALGAVALLASIRRALVVHAGSVKITFHCTRAGARDVAAISDAMQGAG
jgi:hypothetical protein